MFWEGPVLDSKAVWIHVASLKLFNKEIPVNLELPEKVS